MCKVVYALHNLNGVLPWDDSAHVALQYQWAIVCNVLWKSAHALIFLFFQ